MILQHDARPRALAALPGRGGRVECKSLKGHHDTTHSAEVTPGPAATHSVRWRVHIALSPDWGASGTVHDLAVGSTLFGRAPDGTGIAFDDPRMSRNHCALVDRGGRDSLELIDLDSRNGTWLAGRRTSRARVGHGAVLRVGGTLLIVESDLGRSPEYGMPTPEMPGVSEAARMVRAALDRAARDSLPCLIHGETGTGKEFAASELYRRSGRPGALVRVNLAAVAETLFESELFGHARGAFTGASAATQGRIREADRGMLVFDEIGELTLPLQAKLLRVLEEGHVRPVGGSADVAVDVRFVASTNAALGHLVGEGTFRRDLLARLRSHVIQLPPLVERRPDLMELCDAVLPRAVEPGATASWREQTSIEAAEALHLHLWPDNLRDLRAALVHADAHRRDGRVSLSSLPPDVVARSPALAARPAARTSEVVKARPSLASAVFDRPSEETLRELLARHAGNIDHVAQELGRHRRQIYRWLDYAGIDGTDLARYRDGQP